MQFFQGEKKKHYTFPCACIIFKEEEEKEVEKNREKRDRGNRAHSTRDGTKKREAAPYELNDVMKVHFTWTFEQIWKRKRNDKTE